MPEVKGSAAAAVEDEALLGFPCVRCLLWGDVGFFVGPRAEGLPCCDGCLCLACPLSRTETAGGAGVVLAAVALLGVVLLEWPLAVAADDHSVWPSGESARRRLAA